MNTSSWVDLARAVESVTGRVLDDPTIDPFEFGLDSIALLSLVSHLRLAGYDMQPDDVLLAPTMGALASRLAKS